MRYIRLFEDFKVKNITIEDIVTCIQNGGVIYSAVINNYPENDSELPLTPLSIDDDGTVTVDIDGQNYEVELRNIDKIEWM